MALIIYIITCRVVRVTKMTGSRTGERNFITISLDYSSSHI
jgi:hypothetical protein